MGWIKVMVTAGSAELLAHFLSLQGGFMLMVLAFIVSALRVSATDAKAADTKKRVDLLVPEVGAVKDTADYASGRADTAYTNAGNAQSTANSAASTASSAQSTANNALSSLGDYLPLVGGTVSGALTVNGDLKTRSDLIADGNLYAPNDNQISVPQTRAYGLLSAPSSYTQAWGASVVNWCVDTGGALGNAGVLQS